MLFARIFPVLHARVPSSVGVLGFRLAASYGSFFFFGGQTFPFTTCAPPEKVTITLPASAALAPARYCFGSLGPSVVRVSQMPSF